jgi:hypothetical protein
MTWVTTLALTNLTVAAPWADSLMVALAVLAEAATRAELGLTVTDSRFLYEAGAQVSTTWLIPALAVTATHCLLNDINLPLIEKWNEPWTESQTVIVGLTLLAVLTAAFAVPATRKLLPMATTGAKSNNKAECFRTLLCTMFSSHHCRLNRTRNFGAPARRIPPRSGGSRCGFHFYPDSKHSRCRNCSI